MTAEVTETQVLHLPIEDVFDVVVDLTDLSRWNPVFDVSRRVDTEQGEQDLHEGATFEVVADTGGRSLPITYTLEEYERPLHAVVVGRGDGFTTVDEVELRSTRDGGCELRWHARVEDGAEVLELDDPPLFMAVNRASMAGLRETLGH